MALKHLLINLAFALIATSALAQGRDAEGGLRVDGAIGQPELTVENPDGSKARYSGLALLGRGHFPLVYNNDFGAGLSLGLKYMDLSNNGNTTYQKEYSNHMGPGIGARITAYKFYLGAEYHWMAARNATIGKVSREINYNYTMLSTYAGLGYEFGFMDVGLSYHTGTSSIPSTASGLSKSSPFTETLIMFNITVNTGLGVANAFKNLAK